MDMHPLSPQEYLRLLLALIFFRSMVSRIIDVVFNRLYLCSSVYQPPQILIVPHIKRPVIWICLFKLIIHFWCHINSCCLVPYARIFRLLLKSSYVCNTFSILVVMSHGFVRDWCFMTTSLQNTYVLWGQ